jgi:hypothetical protein
VRKVRLASAELKISNNSIKIKKYETMIIQNKLDDKIIKMKFANIVYVLIINITLVSSIKLINQEYDKNMHTKILVHVVTDQKICNIKKHFEMMTLKYVKNATSINSRSAIVTKSVSNEQKNKMLTESTSKKKEEMKNSFRSITNSEQITHEKSDREHIMKFYQSNKRQ